MPKVLITNTCHVRDRLYRKGVTADLDDEAAASVVASAAGVVVAPPAPPAPAVQAVPVVRTAVDPTATAAVRAAVKLGG